ncbi:MAG: TonB-dependent receptor [Chitinophagaceae bacterium]|nr:TonB-dependent receptor [Chitinophagaceae bacterium]
MKNIFLFYFFILVSCASGFAQGQVIRGAVTDYDSKIPLTGVNVILYKDSIISKVVATDENGLYRLDAVALGRNKVKFSYLGYEEQTISNVIVTSAKEVILNAALNESVNVIDEVVVTAFKPGETRNEMATVSARPFTIEETDRYAGSRGDPARMASNFAGVQGADDSRNDIVIRGNSPGGVLWKMEGVPMLNPNHFNIPGTTGSPVTILNNKFLANSDFFTGAFPAEFGNTISGVFDLFQRNGNNEKYEFSGQVGFLGLEAMAEGPILKEHKSSFLATYRYSTLQLFDVLGIDIGTNSIPNYQDGFFRLNFPLKKNASLSVFGMGGLSKVDILISDQQKPEADLYAQSDRDQYFNSKMGITGITYSKTFSARTYMKATVAAQGNAVIAHHDLVYRHIGSDGNYALDSLLPILDYTFKESRISAVAAINHKFNSHWLMKAGFSAEALLYNYMDSTRNLDSTSAYYYQYYTRWDSKGTTSLIQPYMQFKYKPNDRLTFNVGLHAQYFGLSNSVSLFEPRLGIQYDLGNNQLIAFGTGLHSQQQNLYLYFYRLQDSLNKPLQPHNLDMDFTKSMHFVGSYSKLFAEHYFLKAEVYYQYLFNVPVDTLTSSFSLINTGVGFSRFFPLPLENAGTGVNYGAELTLQRVFYRQYFFMITGSLFQSTYKGSDDSARNSDFNAQYVLNLLGTKEFTVRKKNTFSIGAKLTTEGGHWYGPVDTLQSEIQKEVIYQDAGRNSLQFAPYFRFDLKFNYRINAKKMSHEIGLDLVNVFDTQNILGLTYIPNDDDPSRSVIQENYQLGRLPLFYYRIDF